MTINAVSRNFACLPSYDGIRYTAYPAGNHPAEGGSWILDAGEFAQSRIAADIIAPRPTAEQGSASRYLWAHSGIDYVVPISVMGGAPPFWFEVSGVTGATIERKAPAFNPGAYSWAVVTIPAATVAAWSAAQSITVDVYDQENTVTPVASVTWSITKNDAKFLFLDAVGGSALGAGTLADPMSSIEDYYGASATDDTHVGKICVYRTGTYALDQWVTMPGTSGALYWYGAYKPVGHIAYPGESPIWDFNALPGYSLANDLLWADAMDDWFFGGIQCYRGRYNFKASHRSARITLWDVDVVDTYCTSGTNDNLGVLSSAETGTAHDLFALCDIRLDGIVNEAGANNGGLCVIYRCDRIAIDGAVFTDCADVGDALFLKAEVPRGTVTGCSFWSGSTYDRVLYLGNRESLGGITDKILQSRYSRVYKATDTAATMAFGDSTDVWGDIYEDRVTLVGGNTVYGAANGSAYMTESVVVNDSTPIVHADVATTDVLTYTRAGSPLDADGKLSGASQYTRGFELRNIP